MPITTALITTIAATMRSAVLSRMLMEYPLGRGSESGRIASE